MMGGSEPNPDPSRNGHQRRRHPPDYDWLAENVDRGEYPRHVRDWAVVTRRLSR